MVYGRDLMKFESVSRISSLPIVESSWQFAEHCYFRFKKSNAIVDWSLGTAENSMNLALGLTLPIAMTAFELPIQVLDKVLCKSLDVVESRVPSIHLTPDKIYTQTKEYVDEKFVRPVLKRANSVKQLGNTVLESKYTELAAGTLDEAITTVDKYMDKYLPDEDDLTKEGDETDLPVDNENTKKAVQTIHRVDRFSRKLQRRLTKRTLREAKALKDHSTEIYHSIIYALQLIVTNPKQASENALDLWKMLSKDEPENQKPPNTLDDLIAILVRESARRIVHFINHASTIVSKMLPLITHHILILTHQCIVSVGSFLKNIHTDVSKSLSIDQFLTKANDLKQLWSQLSVLTTALFEHLAVTCAGQARNSTTVTAASSSSLSTTTLNRNDAGSEKRLPTSASGGGSSGGNVIGNAVLSDGNVDGHGAVIVGQSVATRSGSSGSANSTAADKKNNSMFNNANAYNKRNNYRLFGHSATNGGVRVNEVGEVYGEGFLCGPGTWSRAREGGVGWEGFSFAYLFLLTAAGETFISER